jgi:hypothetical protein
MSRRAARWTLVAVCALGLVVLVFLVFTFWERKITNEEALQARDGMSLAEVEKRFGGPGKPVSFQPDPAHPGDLLVVLDCPSRHWIKEEEALDPASTWRVWPGHEVLWVFHFKDGVVVDKFGAGNPRRPWLK